MHFDIITIFPKIFDSYFNESILARAQKNKLIDIGVHNLRDHTTDKHHMVDDKPYGGGVGMVLKIDPIWRCVQSLKSKIKNLPQGGIPLRGKKSKKQLKNEKLRIILFSAKGKKLNQEMIRKLAKYDRLIMICGRYEGVDERVARHIADEEISIGEYVLTGGELPAMVVVDAVSRMIPGVVGKEESIRDESFKKTKDSVQNSKFSREAGSRFAGKIQNYLEYPHYTRPEIFSPDNGKTKWRVPKVLLSGNHQKIEEWKEKYSKLADK